MSQLGRCFILGLAMAAVFASATTAPAAIELTILVNGLKFTYDESQNGSLFDENPANSIAGGTGNIADAAQLTGNIDFYDRNDTRVYRLPKAQGLYCDFLMDGIENIPVGGGTVTTTANGSHFGFDLISADPTIGQFLCLNLDTATVIYDYNEALLKFIFIADSPSVVVESQHLPGGLSLYQDSQISVSVWATGVAATDSDMDGFVDYFTTTTAGYASVVMEVPEPASFVALLAMAVIGLEIRASRQRTRQQRMKHA